MSLGTSSTNSTSSGQNWSSSQTHQYRQHQLQQQPQFLEATSSQTAGGRRMLPSPVLKQESEKARNVRMLLAKHQEQVNQLLQLRAAQEINAAIKDQQIQEIPVRENPNRISAMIDVDDENDEDDMQFLSARLPGNSFPATSPLMVATSMAGSADNDDSDENDDQVIEDKELLKRLRQGQERMEQIKRMLVNQRGYIVESLRQLAQSNSERNREQEESRCTNCSHPKSGAESHNANSFEQDRTLGRTYVEYSDRKSGLEPENDSRNSGRLCPMCEAVFPVSVTSEDFELHVMEHFNFEDSETLVYVPPQN